MALKTTQVCSELHRAIYLVLQKLRLSSGLPVFLKIFELRSETSITCRSVPELSHQKNSLEGRQDDAFCASRTITLSDHKYSNST